MLAAKLSNWQHINTHAHPDQLVSPAASLSGQIATFWLKARSKFIYNVNSSATVLRAEVNWLSPVLAHHRTLAGPNKATNSMLETDTSWAANTNQWGANVKHKRNVLVSVKLINPGIEFLNINRL